MPFERRPDGSMRLTMHQPLYQVIVVMLVSFGIGGMFVYGMVYNEGTDIVVRNYDTGYDLPVLVWRIFFLLGAVVALGAGFFILLGLLRGAKPHVRIDARRIMVAGMAMASDKSMRWDEIAQVRRIRIMHGAGIVMKSKSGRKLQLSDHVFPHGNDFKVLCGEIEARVANAQSGIPGATPG